MASFDYFCQIRYFRQKRHLPRAPFCHEIWTFARSMSNLSTQFAIFARSAIFVKTATLQGVRFALWFFAWFSIFARFASFVSFATVTLQEAFKFSPNLWRVFFGQIGHFCHCVHFWTQVLPVGLLHSTLSGFFSSLIILLFSAPLYLSYFNLLYPAYPALVTLHFSALLHLTLIFSIGLYSTLVCSGVFYNLLYSTLTDLTLRNRHTTLLQITLLNLPEIK